MKPKEAMIDRAKKDGVFTRVNRLLSAVHILNYEANQCTEEVSDLLNKYGLKVGRLKQLHNNFLKSADIYFHEFGRLVINEEQKMEMFEDMDSFDKVFRQWSGLEKEWEPQKTENYDHNNQ